MGSKIVNLIQKLLSQICVLQHLSDVRVRLAKIKYRMTANALNGQLSVVSLLVKNRTGEEEDRLGFGGGS